jgi:hypothetical protein
LGEELEDVLRVRRNDLDDTLDPVCLNKRGKQVSHVADENSRRLPWHPLAQPCLVEEEPGGSVDISSTRASRPVPENRL